MIFTLEKLFEKEKLKSHGRITELDFLKGIALILMILNHLFFDLSAFFAVDISSFESLASIVGKTSAIIFMTVCGISATIGKRNIQNGLKLLALATALSIATAVFDRVTGSEICIKFGILHFLGFAMIISYFCKKLPVPVLFLLAAVSYALGKYFLSFFVNSPFLFPLGLRTRLFFSGDYYPLFPNLCYVFLGNALGKVLYKEKKSVFKKQFKVFEPLRFLGRHTLVIYFVHQPLMLLILIIISFFLKNFNFIYF